MLPAALLPAIALIAGTACGVAFELPTHAATWLLAIVAPAALCAWCGRRDRVTIALLLVALASAGFALGSHARADALETRLRLALDGAFGGFLMGDIDVAGQHAPVLSRLVLAEDATLDEDGATLRGDVAALRIRDDWLQVEGGVVVSVGGVPNARRAAEWRRGRTIEAPILFRRPARYLDEGVADFERQAALDGTSLLGSVKSSLLVAVIARGSILDEAAAAIRAYVRDTIARRVAPHSALSAAIVTAVLIGDRGGLPGEVRLRLQSAGTYHVIAISGGNIAILALVIVIALAIVGLSGRVAAVATLLVLVAYADVVTAGPSVWRATLVAAAYLVARVLDHRSPPWQAMAIAGGLLAVAAPLDVRNAGFLLTFGATAALLEVARRSHGAAAGPADGPRYARAVVAWLWMSASTSLAVELVLLPVMAATFSRVTAAGIVLNMVAVPAMAVVQIAGMVVVAVDWFDAGARTAGWIAHLGAAAIVGSARLVEIAPWLAMRVPSPGPLAIVSYYSALAMCLAVRRRPLRVAGGTALVASALVIMVGVRGREDMHGLRLTMIDVGQGDGMLLQSGERTLMVDAGGSLFGVSSFDIGSRVVEPALWSRGVWRLDTMLFTHGDPDHIGGAPTLVDDFHPREVWQGIPVWRNRSLRALLSQASAGGAVVTERREGEELRFGAARILVLHPEVPDWERRKVRNDDSVVLEVIDGDVAMLLTGDIGADVERALIPHIVRAKTRILKVAHHGSRTSTSQALLDAWQPQIALVSCGRGNPFGHPAPDVIARLDASGARIYRTDRDGEITVDTDGREVRVRTFMGRKQ